MSKRIAESILKRFIEEHAYICRYVKFLETASAFDDKRLMRLNHGLARFGFPKYKLRTFKQMVDSFPSLSAIELKKLAVWVESIEVLVEQRLTEGYALASSLPIGELPDEDYNLYDLIFTMVELVESDIRTANQSEIVTLDFSTQTLNKVKSALAIVAKNSYMMDGFPEEYRFSSDEQEKEAVASALHLWVSDKVNELELILHEFEQLKIVARAASPKSEINVYRQGFILLMTAFDATIFDLTRNALRKNFFQLSVAFGKQEKVPMAEIAESGSFNALRDKLIEEQLKKRYIKDILVMLNGEWKVVCVDPNGKEKFVRLIEMVLRRNIHVHNRGVVDKRYIEDKNLDGFRLGQVAVIDESYWQIASNICLDCVERVAAWSGGKPLSIAILRGGLCLQ